MTNTDRIVDYILNNMKELTAPKIEALAEVIASLSDEVVKEPNAMVNDAAVNMLDEDSTIPLTDIEKVQFEGMTPKDVRIYQ